jgi:hypothetical protein
MNRKPPWDRLLAGNFSATVFDDGPMERSRPQLSVAPKALKAFKDRIREITCRSGGRSLTQFAEQLRLYLLGWKSYFGLAQTLPTFKDLESWIRFDFGRFNSSTGDAAARFTVEVKSENWVCQTRRLFCRMRRQSLVASQLVAP